MKFHKTLNRERFQSFPIDRRITMVASEFSRASHLTADGDAPLVRNCYLRARELFGLLEITNDIPSSQFDSLTAISHQISIYAVEDLLNNENISARSQELYQRLMDLVEH